LINAPKTDEITITQHPGDQSMTLNFAIVPIIYEGEREREGENQRNNRNNERVEDKCAIIPPDANIRDA
jgi:hypothetical protein